MCRCTFLRYFFAQSPFKLRQVSYHVHKFFFSIAVEICCVRFQPPWFIWFAFPWTAAFSVSQLTCFMSLVLSPVTIWLITVIFFFVIIKECQCGSQPVSLWTFLRILETHLAQNVVPMLLCHNFMLQNLWKVKKILWKFHNREMAIFMNFVVIFIASSSVTRLVCCCGPHC